jgi:hypothetical protein
MLNLPVTASSFSKSCADGGKFGNRCKHVKVVNTWDLGKALCNETGFVSDNISYYVLLCVENPF